MPDALVVFDSGGRLHLGHSPEQYTLCSRAPWRFEGGLVPRRWNRKSWQCWQDSPGQRCGVCERRAAAQLGDAEADPLAQRILASLRVTPRTGLVAGELAILTGAYDERLDEALRALVANGDVFTRRITAGPAAGLVRYHPAGAVPLPARAPFPSGRTAARTEEPSR